MFHFAHCSLPKSILRSCAPAPRFRKCGTQNLLHILEHPGDAWQWHNQGGGSLPLPSGEVKLDQRHQRAAQNSPTSGSWLAIFCLVWAYQRGSFGPNSGHWRPNEGMNCMIQSKSGPKPDSAQSCSPSQVKRGLSQDLWSSLQLWCWLLPACC